MIEIVYSEEATLTHLRDALQPEFIAEWIMRSTTENQRYQVDVKGVNYQMLEESCMTRLLCQL